MDYITINEACVAVIEIPESKNSDTVTYAIYKASDSSTFASGNASFVAGINWKITFTPLLEDTYIVEVYNSTLDVKYSKNFKAVRNASMTASIPAVTALTDAQMIVKINEAITARLNGGAVQSYSIGGRNIQYMSLNDLLKLRRELEQSISNAAGGARNFVTFVDPQ